MTNGNSKNMVFGSESIKKEYRNANSENTNK